MSLMLSIFTEKSIQNTNLPNISDSDYSIVLDKIKFGFKKNLVLELQIIDNEWTFKKTKYTILRDDGKPFDSPINARDWFTVKNTGEALIKISVSDVNISFDSFKKYLLYNGIKITIGRDEQCAICYNNQNYVGREHTVIQYENDWEIVDKSKNGVFVNGKRIVNTKKLSIGDKIEIYGLKMVFLGSILAIGIGDGVVVNEQILRPCEEQMEILKIDANIKEKNYFHRSPRENLKIYDETVEIEVPPDLRKPEQQPLAMTIGPSLTMAVPMLLGTGISILARGSSSGTFMYTGIITAVSSAVIGTVWTLIRLKNTNKKFDLAEQKRFDSYSKYLIDIADKIKQMYETNIHSMNKQYPSAAECSSYNETSEFLWNRNSRHSDIMYYRLGTGELPFQTEIIIPKERFKIENDELKTKPSKIKEEFKTLYNVPVGIDLLQHRLIGIVGGKGKEGAFEVVKCLSIQIAAANSYTDVKMGFVYDKKQEFNEQWGFVKWFPHVWMEEKKGRFIASDQIEASNLFFNLTNILRIRSENSTGYGFNKSRFIRPHYVLFIENSDWLEGEPIVKYISEAKEEYGITTVLMAEKYTDLPNACDYIIYNDKDFRGVYDISGKSNDRTTIKFDFIENRRADSFSRRLMNIEVAETEIGADIVSSLDFFEMYGVKRLEDFNITDRWKKNRTYISMKALIGKKAGGSNCYLDIHEKYHGPHGLIAGTTGSGKSETLQTYMLSLAINFSPYDIAFFVIDFKGGGMANLFSDLPHSIGSISNLSGSQVRRAMLSIKSENMRRQRIFSENGVNNINNYTKLLKNNEATIPIPHLFIIIDEFAELKREEPEFMKELISVAQVGRSLGVHLILATQKPSGTVDDNIWSNSKFRLCLRVQDRQDSNDMLHKPDAAYITQAGRGYLQVGNDELYEYFQSGWSGAPYSEYMDDTNSDIAVLLGMDGKAEMVGSKQRIQQKERKRREWINLLSEFTAKAFGEMKLSSDKYIANTNISEEIINLIIKYIREKDIKFDDNAFYRMRIGDFIELWKNTEGETDRIAAIIINAEMTGKKLPEIKEITQLDAVVEYLGKISAENGYRQSMQLWLPVLPDKLYLDELQGYRESSGTLNNFKKVSGDEWELEAFIGKYDDPANQAQNSMVLDFAANGHLAVCGMVVSGKSTFMQTLIFSLINRYSSEHINFYLLDFSSKMMSAFEKSNHVGGIMYENDLEKIKKFFKMIADILKERKDLFKGGNYSQYVRTHGVVLPAIMICIDNYEGFRSKTQNEYDSFILKLSSESVSYGIYLVITAGGFGTNEIPNSLGDNIKTTISLEMTDKFKYGEILKSMKFDIMPESNIRGRGMAVINDRILEFQTALSLEASDDYSRLDAIRECCEKLNQYWNTNPAVCIPEIPKNPIWQDIVKNDAFMNLISDNYSLPVAYNEQDASLYSIDLKNIYCYTLAGRKKSGKTNMLKILTESFVAKNSDVCIIDSENNELKQFSENIGVEYVSDEEALCVYLEKLIDTFILRNKQKNDYIAQGISGNKLYIKMMEHKRIAVLINNFEEFAKTLKKPLKSNKYDFYAVMGNLFEKGAMHNIYFVGTISPDNHSQLVGNNIYNLFIADKQGILMGGNAMAQKLFVFNDLKYSEQSKVYKPGIGLTVSEETGTQKIVLPMHHNAMIKEEEDDNR